MDPSQEKRPDTPAEKPKTYFVPAVLVTLFLMLSTGLGVFFYSGSTTTPTVNSTDKTVGGTTEAQNPVPQPEETTPAEEALEVTSPEVSSSSVATDSQQKSTPPPATPDERVETPSPPKTPPEISPSPDPTPSPCQPPENRLHAFFSTLDDQAYMAQYNLSTGSEQHFTALIQKLLNNPPQVTRESDDLYTILKNTAHFFRISGKDNVFMMKGILGNEKGHIEQILADYYFLISTPECASSPQIADIDQEALYEYACFFLNTMGGRLYLFRRDSLSRMVVTYYAILLVDRANRQQNNKHGLDLQIFIKMLSAEMETGGSSLKYSQRYLDSLSLMQEKYQ